MSEKICPKCGDSKDLDDFAWRDKKRGRRSSECRDCHKRYRQDYYHKNRTKTLREVKVRKRELRRKMYLYLTEHPCVDCGEIDPILLDFDHVRGKKTMGISKMVDYGYGWNRILKEITKCLIRCVRCHRLKTAREERWYWWLKDKARMVFNG